MHPVFIHASFIPRQAARFCVFLAFFLKDLIYEKGNFGN